MSEDDPDLSNIVVYTIPGKKGRGSESEYVKQVIAADAQIIKVNTPSFASDLGQYFCGQYLDQALTQADKEGIIYATSQGTATALNYIATNAKGKKIKGLVLEGVLASGNSALYHTLSGPREGIECLKKIPGACYMVPYIGIIVCPGYRPGGKQAIKSIDTIQKDLPIVIVHSKKDAQTPFDGACALYYRLRSSGNNKAYLVSKDGWRHKAILESDDEKDIVKRILKNHLQIVDNNLVPTQSVDDDLTEFQPEPSQFKKQYDELIAKETKHAYIERTVVSIAGLAILLKYILGY